MKGIQINPYNLVAMYATDTEASLQSFLYSPTLRLPPIQFYLPTEEDPVASWDLVNISTGAVVAQDATQWGTEADADGHWNTYFGAALQTPPGEGMYRARVVTEAALVYWSHAMCLTRIFDTVAKAAGPSLAIDQCTQTNGYRFYFEATGATRVGVVLNGVAQADQLPTFSLAAGATPARVDTWVITLYSILEDSNGGGTAVQRSWTLVVSDPSDACANYTFAATGSASGTAGEELMFLEWRNTKDVRSAHLLYQVQTAGTYTQRMYLKAWRGAPVPALESEFLVDIDGGQVLRSATVAEDLVLQCWPVPDYAFTVLAAAGVQDTKALYNMSGGGTALDALAVATRAEGNSDQATGLFACTVNRRYLSGCEEDFDLQ